MKKHPGLPVGDSCEIVSRPNKFTPLMSSVRTGLALGALLLMGATPAWATCTNVNGTYTCTGTTTNQTIGTGQGAANDNITVNVNPGATISAGDRPAISLHDNAVIDIGIGAHVSNAANHGSGNYNSGANTIEVRNNSTITVRGDGTSGGQISSLGPQGQAEAINVQGYGNTIVVEKGASVISSATNATIWFQDTVTSNDPNLRNKVDNYGVIQHTTTSTGAVIGSQGGNHTAGIIFTNRTGGLVQGSLSFGAGDDDLIFEDGSLVTGNINGGGGSNTLTLQGENSGYLEKDISNFQTMTKEGNGEWTLSGKLNNFNTVLVEDGTLRLEGDNTNFHGTITINSTNTNSDATLEARAQSLPSGASGGITNNGHLVINQVSGDDGSYGSLISGSGDLQKQGGGTLTLTGDNTYTGGTWVKDGTVAITQDSSLGGSGSGSGVILGTDAAGGNNNGTLALDNSIDLDASRTIELKNGGGTIQTADGTSSSVNNTISGSGSLRKTGDGTLTLNTANTYTGGTNIVEGTVVIDQEAALGNGGRLTMGGDQTNGALQLAGNNDITLNQGRGPVQLNEGGGTFDTNGKSLTINQAINGDGSLTKTGDGTLVLNSIGSNYEGGTNINQGTVVISDSRSLGADVAGNDLSFGTDSTSGTLRLNGSSDVILSDQRQVNLNAGGGVIDTNGRDLTIQGTVSGAGGLTKDGNGTLALHGNNSYQGDTYANQGTVAINSNTSLLWVRPTTPFTWATALITPPCGWTTTLTTCSRKWFWAARAAPSTLRTIPGPSPGPLLAAAAVV